MIEWESYITASEMQEAARINQYIREASVHSNALLAEVPRFGRLFESKVYGGEAFPTMFVNCLTASDVASLKRQLRVTQNAALKRTIPDPTSTAETRVKYDFEIEAAAYVERHKEMIRSGNVERLPTGVDAADGRTDDSEAIQCPQERCAVPDLNDRAQFPSRAFMLNHIASHTRISSINIVSKADEPELPSKLSEDYKAAVAEAAGHPAKHHFYCSGCYMKVDNANLKVRI